MTYCELWTPPGLTTEQRIAQYKKCLKQFSRYDNESNVFNLFIIQGVLVQWAEADPSKLNLREFTIFQKAIDNKIANLLQCSISPPRTPKKKPKILHRDPMARLQEMEESYRNTGDLDKLKKVRQKIKNLRG